MTENESINGWTFEETAKTAENLMEAESNMFKWDVLRHLRDFAENYKDELEQYRAIGTVEHIKLTFELCKGLDAMVKMYQSIGTIEEFKALKENTFFNFGSPLVRIDEKSYNKAIDEFAEKLNNSIDMLDLNYEYRCDGGVQHQTLNNMREIIQELSEQLKAGV